ncbi:MAG: SUMF1/EgtB/PvdO family nonheme iron enzyme [Nitrospira sp.]|nr:SUMF1/EgtB/PvdO family nonheme iron enzyme [Nitrospira sp.]MDR4470755.1 SUMF1/EgtB/PvdO family nonheme iron enzyme [Nitrospira sp.]
MTANHFDVFLSYHWRDHTQVESLANWLRGQKLEVFLDRWYLTPGQSWPKALETTLARCSAVAICLGQGEMGPWQQREQYLALERQVAAERQGQKFPVIPVLLPGAEPPLGFLSQNTWVDFRAGADDPVLLNTLAHAIYRKPPGPDALETVRNTLATICPYRGLLYFREEDAPFFFGREAAIAQLVSAVQQHSLVAVVGASGRGKSSVVRAGLVPELRKGRDRVWEVATIVPTDRPVHALAAVIMPLLEPDMTETDRLIEISKLAEGLLSRTIKLREVVDRVLAKQPGTDSLMLIADQWEELFTLCEEEATRRCFIDNILEATATTKLNTVLTLRGDFFGRAITDYRPLSDRVQGAQVNLGPMNRQELRLAIEEPAKKVGLTFEAGLVDLMLEQASDEPGHLPLLEFVLRQLWEQRRGGELHHEAYRAMGQLEGAIAAKADSIFSRLNAQDQRRVQQIFLRLVRPGEGEADTRRRATSSELGVEAQSLVKTLADERLVVTSRLASSVEDTVEVSHEALVRHWSHLKGWVDADRQFLVWQQRLNMMKKEWDAGQRSTDLLLRGLPLREAEAWLKKKPESFSSDERGFITASQNRRTRARAVAAIGAGVVLWLIGGTTWLWQKGYTVDQAALKIQSIFVSIHVSPQMVQIPAGTFQMGDVEKLGDSWRNPVHQVTIKAFAMGRYEGTFKEYDRFAITKGKPLPGDQGWGRSNRPVINVSWDEAKTYAEWLSKQTGLHYRLPTESEWEYAARSSAKQHTWAGTSKESDLDQYAVFAQNSGNRTAEVGTKAPNELGIEDLSGNVFEWVEDCQHSSYERAPRDGSAWLGADERSCNLRVVRGGSWNYPPESLRASNRNWIGAGNRSNNIGFRLAQDLP